MSFQPNTRSHVQITAYSRLHFGFFDLNHTFSRRFGSMGVSIDAFTTRIRMTYNSVPEKPCNSNNSAQVPAWIEALLATLLVSQATESGLCREQLQLHIEEMIPRHSGLGSGTQMALALASGLQFLAPTVALQADVPAAHAVHANRGKRSGIGIAAFQQGGIVIDGGRGPHSTVPPVIFQQSFPQAWRFLLILETAQQGLHGEAEISAFQQLTSPSVAATHALAYEILMRGMPALIEQDYTAFCQTIADLQAYNAHYFSPVQGGLYASQAVSQVLNTLQAQGYVGCGQSSWGPTGFVLLPNAEDAQTLLAQCAQTFAHLPLRFMVSAAVNHGAQVEGDVAA